MNKTSCCPTRKHRPASDRQRNEVWLPESAFHLFIYPTEIKTESFAVMVQMVALVSSRTDAD